MHINTRLDFAADPAAVFAMMIDQKYQEEVCVASDSTSYDVTVSGDRTSTSRTLPAPESAARFTGPHLTIKEDTAWGGAGGDGSRTADLTMTVVGQPVTLKGQLRLAPGGRGTVIELDGELKVAIPLLGKKLEQSSAPAVMAGFRTQQAVGDSWLSR